MIVCVCNCVKDREFSAAAAQGCGKVSELYRTLGCQPQCGKCIPYVRETYLNGGAQVSAISE